MKAAIITDFLQQLAAIDIIKHRALFTPIESATMGYFIIGHTRTPDQAYPYFAQAALGIRPPLFVASLLEDLRKEGHPAWADKISQQRHNQSTPNDRPQ